MNCKIFYRISSESQSKPKLPGATKLRCLENFVKVFGEENLMLIADNCDPEMLSKINGFRCLETGLGNSRSFLYALGLAAHYPDNTLIYFVEDDYLHLPNSPKLLQEGIQLAEYVTLYDHPDKYGPLYDGGEYTKVYRTATSHWRGTISTCMSFAARAETLREDLDVWTKWCQGVNPDDHGAFCHLHGHMRKLVVSIPGAACHTDLTYSMVEERNLMEPWAIEMMIKTVEQSIYGSWDADAIETMEEVLHHQKHVPLERLALISEIEAFSQKKKSERTMRSLALRSDQPDSTHD